MVYLALTDDSQFVIDITRVADLLLVVMYQWVSDHGH